MMVGFVIVFGAAIGFIAYKIQSTGFGLWWNVYLGIAGAVLANCIMAYGYLMNFLSNRDVASLNLFGIMVDIAGAAIFIYAARFYSRAGSVRRMRYN